MQRDEIDGVTVVWHPAAGQLSATLTFGCGLRDEDVDRIGLTHLVQLLVRDTVGVPVDSMTSMVDSHFSTAGPPESVVQRLAAICAALAAPPFDTLAEVAASADPGDRFLDLDIEDSTRDPWGSLLAHRLGPAGLGLARWAPVAYQEFTKDEIRAHVARGFAAGNAVLALSGPPPEGLRLPLPAGPRTATASSLPIVTTPSWYADQAVAPGMALSAAPGPEALAVVSLLDSRVSSALQAHGLDYWQSCWYSPVDASRVEIGLSLHAVKGRRKADPAYAAAALWRELRRLARGDLTVEDLRPIADGRNYDDLERSAKAALLGVSDEPTSDQLREAAELSPAAVATAAVGWLRSATIVVPTGVTAELDGLTEIRCPRSAVVPSGDVLRPSRWRRWRNGADERLVLAPDGCHVVAADGGVHSFPVADAILIERGDELLLGNTRHGCVIDISEYAGADRIGDLLPARRRRRAAD
ncbi:MAG: hypothetical protein HOU81_06950 [Hamadaea sp.]|uniref:hypothetical protein n=1 Tax=Hamadaea sp. TaxID=2024425 RepID=UPI0017E01E9D|nr:hypothetical protein [Hamadaea sp.]NUR70540.1 hypothetical protein [Hamadaea sp.]NUT18147.1 hypothetical protein [Hamadaea sp.]